MVGPLVEELMWHLVLGRWDMVLGQDASICERLKEKVMVMAFPGVFLCYWHVVQNAVP